MLNSIIDVQKHEHKLRKIIELNSFGSLIYTDKSSEAIAFGCSKSEFIAALKKDIEKTTKDLIDSYPIIKSITNGFIMEINSLDNSVESFFKSCYDSSSNTITLSTIKFNLDSKNTFPLKKEIVETIYENVLSVTRKELNNLNACIKKYEETKDDVKKALLYPSLELSDRLIEKVGHQHEKFNNYIKTLSTNEKISFDATFKRSGVTEVIQNSTYIDKNGIRQSAHKNHSSALNTIYSMFKNNELKYIEAVEIDGDGDVQKVLRCIKQIERLKINCKYKFTFKFRKLGNLNARGVFFHSGLIVAEDVRDTTALLHEIAHFIHLSNPDIYNHDFVNFMIDKMSNRLDFENMRVSELEKEHIQKKIDYYSDPKEVLARTLEIAGLFAFEEGRFIQSVNEFDLIKSREYYEELEGIYFNFLSFDDDTINQMIELYKLFYETSSDEIYEINFSNFSKIDTMYERTEKNKTIEDILREEKRREEKERRELYSYVNYSNIETIIKNKGKLSLIEIITPILQNIVFTGGHKKSNTVADWSFIFIDRSKVLLYLFEVLEKNLCNLDYIDYLNQLSSSRKGFNFTLLENIYYYGLPHTFSGNTGKEIKNHIKENFEINYSEKLSDLHSKIKKTPLYFASVELLNNEDFMINQINHKPLAIQYINELDISYSNKIKYLIYFIQNHRKDIVLLSNDLLMLDKSILTEFVNTSSEYSQLWSLTADLFNLDYVIDAIYNKYPNEYEAIFKRVGKDLLKNYLFMKKFVDIDRRILKFVDKEIKDKFVNKIVETKKIDTPAITVELSSFENQQNESYDELLKNAIIEDFRHTQTNEDLKILKIEEKITDFKGFTLYLINQGIVKSYSRFAKGFIIKNLEKLLSKKETHYSDEILEVFQTGKLF